MGWRRPDNHYLDLAPTVGVHVQVHNVVEGADPTTRVRACSDDEPKTKDREGSGGVLLVSGRVQRVGEGPHPRFDGELRRSELDMSEDASPGPRNPRLGDNTTCF